MSHHGPVASHLLALFTDSHVHPEPHNPEAAYPADALHNDRSRAVVAAINQVGPALVAHLGDVPHPVPDRPTHEATVRLAASIYADLHAELVVVPGNHDVGDKPQGWATAPRATPARHALFQRIWGAPWGRRVLGEGPDAVEVLWIDTPILNTESAMEAEQRAWLLATLRDAQQAGRAVYALAHYPPFLHTADEPEHYDNLAQPARAWLLDTLADHGVRALFCGHVHHIVVNRYRGMDVLILPGISFVRPGYSELSRIAPPPGSDNGREAPHKLGMLFVHLSPQGYRLAPVRLAPPPSPEVLQQIGRGSAPAPCPLAVTWRHDWTTPRSVPANGLDAYRRKLVHNDLPIWAMWELGLCLARVPAADLSRPTSLDRYRTLHAHGLRLIVWSDGPRAQDHAPAIAQVMDRTPGLLAGWELITLDGEVPDGVDTQPLRDAGLTVRVSILDDRNTPGAARFTHFPHDGFGPQALPRLHALPQGCDGLVARVPHDADVSPCVQAICAAQERLGGDWAVLVELPRGAEGERFQDDAVTADRVQAAWQIAQDHPQLQVVLDGFVDMDRGYFARNGLLDGDGRPREAWQRLLALRHGL